MDGRIEALGLAAAAGRPIEARAQVTLVKGKGVEGDRYAAGVGFWQGWPDQEVTFVEGEVADSLGVAALSLRRNIVTRGVRLDALIGRRFRLGEALLEGVRRADPCSYLEAALRPGLLAELAGKGGLRGRILRGGIVRVGDTVSVDDA